MFTDFHNHSLPGIDDGASDLNESLEMFRLAADQNVHRIVLTPHYSQDQNLSQFLRQRKNSKSLIRRSIPGKLSIQLAAEVSLSKDISKEVELSKLTVDNTRYIMIRLPYFSFEDWIDEELHNILYKHRLIPIFTSTDRYRVTYSEDKYEKLLSTPYAAFQFNVKSFSDNENIRTVKRLLSKDRIVILGSNAHNMATRKPNFDQLDQTLAKALGASNYKYLIIQNNHFLKP